MSLPNFDLSGINTGLPNLASYVRGIADSVTAWAAAKFDNSNLLAPYVTFPIPVNLAGQTLAGLSVQNVPIQLPNVIVIPNKLVVAYDSDAGATTLTADVTNMAGVSYVAGRDTRRAESAALFDGLLQAGEAPQVTAALLQRISQRLAITAERRAREADATRVEFFTMVREQSNA